LPTSGIKHWGLSGYANVLPRIKLGVTGQVWSPQSPTISYRQTVAQLEEEGTFLKSGTCNDHNQELSFYGTYQ